MKNNRCGPNGGRSDPRLITGSRGDPPVICCVRGDPPWVYGSRGHPPLLLSTRDGPAIFEARGDPPEIETRGDPPEIKCTRDGPFLRWLVFNSIGCQNGPHGRGMPGWEWGVIDRNRQNAKFLIGARLKERYSYNAVRSGDADRLEER